MTGQQQGYGDLTEFLMARASVADLHHVLAAVLTELDLRGGELDLRGGRVSVSWTPADRDNLPMLWTLWATVQPDPDDPAGQWSVAWNTEESYAAAVNTDRYRAGGAT